MYLDKSFGTQAASNSKLFKKLKWEFIIFQKFEFDKKIEAYFEDWVQPSSNIIWLILDVVP